ncbi:MAG: DUF6599 family protein [bacterium]
MMIKTKGLIISFLLIFFFINSCTNYYKNELLSFLPTQNEIKGWVKKDKQDSYSKNQLYDYINGGAEIFLEYGFDSLITQEYCFKDKSITLEIYKMETQEAAYGIYSFNRDYKLPAIAVGTEGTSEGDKITFWQNRYYVVIQTSDSSKDLLTIAQIVSAKIKEKGHFPQILKYLPTKNRIKQSEKLICGIIGLNNQYYFTKENILNISKYTPAIFANYKSKDDEFKLCVIKYKNSQEIELVFKKLIDLYKNEYVELKQDRITVKTKAGKYHIIQKKNSFLYMVLEASDGENLLLCI